MQAVRGEPLDSVARCLAAQFDGACLCAETDTILTAKQFLAAPFEIGCAPSASVTPPLAPE